MRTTVDLDETVLAVARAKARSEKISLGRAISELALRGLAPGPVTRRRGFPVFEPTPGHLITDDLVDRFRDED